MGRRGINSATPSYTHQIEYAESKHTYLNCQRFIECLPIPGGHHADGQRTLKLLPWQVQILKGIWPPNASNRTEVLISVARRNGKTVFLAAIMTFLLFNLHKKSAPIAGSRFVSAACTKDQARLVFNLIHGWCLSVKQLGENANCKQFAGEIEILSSPGTLYIAVPATARAVLGGNFSAVIADECGFWRTNELATALREGLASVPRTHRLFLSASTVPAQRDHFFYEQITQALKTGYTEHNYHYVAMAHPDDNPADPQVWKKSNPSLGHLLYEESFRESLDQAKMFPQRLNAFKAYRCNMPVEVLDTSEHRLVTQKAFEACNGHPSIPEGDNVVISWDAASTKDLTCIMVASVTKPHNILVEFIIPKATAESSVTYAPWSTWESQGHCKIETKPTVSKHSIVEKYAELCNKYNVLASCSDRWGWPEIQQIAETEGVDMDKHHAAKMDLATQDRALKALQDMVSNRLFVWNNPILAYCIDNVRLSVARTGAVMIDRKASQKIAGKIDGASCLALVALLLSDPQYTIPNELNLKGILL